MHLWEWRALGVCRDRTVGNTHLQKWQRPWDGVELGDRRLWALQMAPRACGMGGGVYVPTVCSEKYSPDLWHLLVIYMLLIPGQGLPNSQAGKMSKSGPRAFLPHPTGLTCFTLLLRCLIFPL